MRTVAYALIIMLVFLLLVAYAILIIASDTDERADRMYRKWKEEVDERNRRSDKA